MLCTNIVRTYLFRLNTWWNIILYNDNIYSDKKLKKKNGFLYHILLFRQKWDIICRGVLYRPDKSKIYLSL